MVKRIIELPARRSFFLFGPRQTGKSTLVEERYREGVWRIDLLLTDLFLQYSRDPALLRRQSIEKIQSEKIRTIFVDEIQRVPLLLNEIQVLMGKFDCQFILTGSSARKLKRGGANLLGGRAIERRLFPFAYVEIEDHFDLADALHFGSLPPLIGKTTDDKIDILSTYVHTYLREEIQSEGLVRNLGGFARFLDMAAAQCGEIVSFSAISRECFLPVRTVQSYYEILEDTLVGFRLEAWQKSLRKRMVAHPKFYLFDLGVANAINLRLTAPIDPIVRGRLFEQFIVLETYRLAQYTRKEINLYYWRTNHGAEVDLLLERHGKILAAFEIKSASNVSGAHLSGLRAFREEHARTPCAVVSLVENPYKLGGFKILPWKHYLEHLADFLEGDLSLLQ